MEETKRSLWKSISWFCKEHPLVGPIGILGALASIIGIPLAIGFWLWPTLPKRELTYAIQPIRTAFVQVSHPSDITVLYKGKPIKGDLSAAQIMIANAGQEAIETQDVKVQLSLVISNAEILDRTLLTPARKGTSFTLATNLPNTRLDLNWNILEKGDNPVIQVLYAGNRDASIVLEGRIKGQFEPKLVSWPTAKHAPWYHILGFAFTVATLQGIATLQGTKRRRRLFFAFLFALVICGFLLGYYGTKHSLWGL
jgi:hypothetical protein